MNPDHKTEHKAMTVYPLCHDTEYCQHLVAFHDETGCLMDGCSCRIAAAYLHSMEKSTLEEKPIQDCKNDSTDEKCTGGL